MKSRRRKQRSKVHWQVSSDESHETLHIKSDKRERIAKAIQSKNVRELRSLCIEEKGLLDHGIRMEAWPIILGDDFSDYEEDDLNTILPLVSGTNKYAAQIKQDVNRSRNILNMVHPSKRMDYINRILRLINSIFDEFDFLCYYQGYHDIAGLILLAFETPEDRKDKRVRKILERISFLLLRDHLTSTLEGTLDHLRLLSLLLDLCNPKLSKLMTNLNIITPVFSLSWILTWFSHDALSNMFPVKYLENETNSIQNSEKKKTKPSKTDIDPLLRLFDYLISNNSDSPIYVAAAVVELGCKISELSDLSINTLSDYTSLHSYITSLINWESVDQVDTIIKTSLVIKERYPIDSLIKIYNKSSIDQIIKRSSFDKRLIAYYNNKKFVLISKSSSLNHPWINFKTFSDTNEARFLNMSYFYSSIERNINNVHRLLSKCIFSPPSDNTSLTTPTNLESRKLLDINFIQELTLKLTLDLEARANYFCGINGPPIRYVHPPAKVYMYSIKLISTKKIITISIAILAIFFTFTRVPLELSQIYTRILSFFKLR